MRLSIRDLVKAYDKNEIFAGAGYSFDEGIIYAIVGENGSGKSTLFDCISGEVDYKGSIELEQDGDLILPGIDTVGVSFQKPMIPEFLTGYEYVRFFLDTHKSKTALDYTVEDYLRLVNLPQNYWGTMIKDYTKDFKNRLQLIGIFISGCPIVLLDEAMLDTPRAEWGHLKELLDAFKSGRIIILATETTEVAEAFADEIILLEKGRFTQPNYEIEEIAVGNSAEEEQ